MTSSQDSTRKRIQERLAEKFRKVTLGRLERLNLAVMSMESGECDEELVNDAMREIHTLKGEAKLVGRPGIGAVSHAVEDLLHALAEVSWQGAPETWDLVLAGLDAVSDRIRADGDDERWDVEQFRAVVDERLRDGVAVSTASEPAVETPEDDLEARDTDDTAEPEPSATELQTSHAPRPQAEPESDDAKTTSQPTSGGGQLLLATSVLDELTNLHGDLQQNHSQTARAASSVATAAQSALQGIRQLERDANARFDIELAAGLGVVAEYLGQLLAEVAGLRELRFDRGLRLQQAETIYRQTRMLPLSDLLLPMKRVMRSVARELGKEITLEIVGGDVRVDQALHSALHGPLLHLIRNAADHGIESPDERAAKGKPTSGAVRILAARRGAFVSLEVSDDGRGIDVAALTEKAVASGVLSQSEVDEMSRGDRLRLVFERGLSTRAEVTEVSGRGLGMDVVREAVETLGGSIRIDSATTGTWFTLSVPTSLAFLGVLLVVGPLGVLYGLPAASVVRVLRLPAQKLEEAAGNIVFDFHNEILPLFDLDSIIGNPQGPAASRSGRGIAGTRGRAWKPTPRPAGRGHRRPGKPRIPSTRPVPRPSDPDRRHRHARGSSDRDHSQHSGSRR